MAFYHLGYFSHFGNAAGESPAAPAFQLSSGIGRREGRPPVKKLLEKEIRKIKKAGSVEGRREGLAMSVIVKFTGLSEEEIRTLAGKI